MMWTVVMDVEGGKGHAWGNFDNIDEDGALNPARLRMFIGIR